MLLHWPTLVDTLWINIRSIHSATTVTSPLFNASLHLTALRHFDVAHSHAFVSLLPWMSNVASFLTVSLRISIPPSSPLSLRCSPASLLNFWKRMQPTRFVSCPTPPKPPFLTSFRRSRCSHIAISAKTDVQIHCVPPVSVAPVFQLDRASVRIVGHSQAGQIPFLPV